MKCQLCDIKEFDVIYNVDHPVEDRPVIFCYECAKQASIHIKWFPSIEEIVKGKRCG